MAEMRDQKIHELECCSAFSRREFVRTLGAGVLAASVPLIGRTAQAVALDGPAKVGPSASDLAETAVARFHKTLSKEQRSLICFPFDHPLRSVVKNNWEIVKPAISDMTNEQQALCTRDHEEPLQRGRLRAVHEADGRRRGRFRGLPRGRLRRAGDRQALRNGC